MSTLKRLVVLDELVVGGDTLLELVAASTMMELAVEKVGTMHTLEVVVHMLEEVEVSV